MTRDEIIRMIEDMLDVESGSLTEQTLLADIEEYDSMAKLSLIVMSDDEFDKKLTGEQILKFVTIQDIVDFLS